MYNEEDSSRSSSSSGNHQMLFDAYTSRLFSDDASCFPEFDYKGDADYVELENSELFANSVGMQTEQQLYQVYMQMDMRQQMTEDFVQQLELEDYLLPQVDQQCLPSSSSSSLRSLSLVSSPEDDTPLFLNKPSSVSIPSTAKELQTPLKQATRSQTDIQFPTPTSEDMAIIEAMMAVISSNSWPSLPETHKNQPKSLAGAFRPYITPPPLKALPPKFQPRKNSSCGQKMIKRSMSILKRISLKKDGLFQVQEKESRPSNQQLDHIISERKRREKLNGSFDTLRRLLPPGAKKDKASVLCKAKEYLKTLKAEICELEEKNRMLGMQYQLPADETGYHGFDGSIERVNIQIAEVSELVTGARRINLKVTVSFECDVIELVLHILECLKGMGFISFVSLDANVYSKERNLFAWAILQLDIQSSDWDELSFKEALMQAADCAALSP